AQAAAHVEVADLDAVGGQLVHQQQYPVDGVQVGGNAGQLRADVAVHANHIDVRQACGPLVDSEGAVNIDTELVFLQPGGDVRVRARIHVGVHPQGYRRERPHPRGDGIDALQLRFGFDIEALDAQRQRPGDLVLGF